MLLGRLLADVGIRAGAETTRERATDVELHVGVGEQERLRVGVDRDELDTLQSRVDHPVDRVAATSADTNYLDHREIVLRSAEHVTLSDSPVARAAKGCEHAKTTTRLSTTGIPAETNSGL